MLKNDEIPYFCWDRQWTVGDIKKRLAHSELDDWVRLIAWIMREAAFRDVWTFVSPKDVWKKRKLLGLFLGRKKDFWNYILATWHELGKV